MPQFEQMQFHQIKHLLFNIGITYHGAGVSKEITEFELGQSPKTQRQIKQNFPATDKNAEGCATGKREIVLSLFQQRNLL